MSEIVLPDINNSYPLTLTLHWTAGTYSDLNLDHYHFVVDSRGEIHAGVPVAKNCPKLLKGYAAHVRGANTNNIGLSAAAMADSHESEAKRGDYGPWPMTEAQVKGMIRAAAMICDKYGIPVVPRRVLGHEEWDSIHGKKQDRWDVNCIPHLDIRPEKLADGTYAAMNWMRTAIRQYMHMSLDPVQSLLTEDERAEIKAGFVAQYAARHLLTQTEQKALNDVREGFRRAGVT